MKLIENLLNRMFTASNAKKGSVWLRAGIGAQGTPERLSTPSNTVFSGFVLGATLPTTMVIEVQSQELGQPEISDFQSGQYIACNFTSMIITGGDGSSVQCIKV